MVDESDKLFEDGRQGFRDQLGSIYRACVSSQIRRAFFSATFASDVQEWCKLNLDNVVTLTIGHKNAATETVDQKLIFVGSESGKLMAFRNLILEVGIVLLSCLLIQCVIFIYVIFLNLGVASSSSRFCPDQRES